MSELVQSFLRISELIESSDAAFANGYVLNSTDHLNIPPDTRWACHGPITPLSGLDPPLKVGNQQYGTLFDPNVDALLATATPAPFGRGTETVIDPSVRNAVEIPASRLNVLELEQALLARSRVRDLIHQVIPVTLYEYQARLYKMHMYTTGGFFRPHRDTLHDPSHHATLVVVLPTEHTGGELVITHNDQRHVFATGHKVLSACVFFTDCLHEVLPVQSGVRIALQFDLWVTPLKSVAPKTRETLTIVESDKEPEEKSAFLSRKCLDVVQKEVDLCKQEGKGLALILSHQYSRSGLKPELLKGIDRLIYDGLVNVPNQVVTLMPCILHKHYEVVLDENKADMTVIPFDPIHGFADFSQKLKFKAVNTVIKADLLQEQEALEWTGNEAQDGYSAYFSSLLIVKIN